MRQAHMTTLLALIAGGIIVEAASVEEQIRAIEKSWAAAVMAGDFATVEKLLGDQLIYAHSTGIVENKSEYMGKLRSGAQKYDAIEHQSMTVKPYGDSVVVHAHMRMAGNSKGQPFDHK